MNKKYDPLLHEEYGQRQPSLAILPYHGETPPKGVVLVSAGGGFTYKSHHEGNCVAARFAQDGYLGAVLDYRVRPYTQYDILNDVRRAVRLLKSLAPSYGYPKDNIALLGFSAGGQVSLLGGTHFDDGNPNSPDPVERFSSRQDLILDPRFSLNLAIRLYEHNLPFELHVYDEGAHGIGLADDTNILKEYSSHHLNTWVSLCSEWLDEKFSR